MSKLAKKLSRQILAIALSVAMIMPNMAVYASEVSPDTQEKITVDEGELDEAQPLLTEEETDTEEEADAEEAAEVPSYTEDVVSGSNADENEAAGDLGNSGVVALSVTSNDTTLSAVFTGGDDLNETNYPGFTFTNFPAKGSSGHGAQSSEADATIKFTVPGVTNETTKDIVDIDVLLCSYSTVKKDAARMTAAATGVTEPLTVLKETVGENDEAQYLLSDPAPKYTVFGVAGGSEVTLTFADKGTYVHNIVATKRTAPKYSIKVESDENGEASVSPVYAAEGATITLTAKPNTEYKLADWTVVSPTEEAKKPAITTDSNDSNKATFTMPAADVEINASFTEVVGATYNVNVFDGYHGTAALKTGQGTGIAKGDEVTLADVVEATPEDGYTFTEWYVTQASDNATKVEVEVTDGKFTMPAGNVDVMPVFSGAAKDGYTYNFRGNKADRAQNAQLKDYGIITFDGIKDIDNDHGFLTEKDNATMTLKLLRKATVTVETCVYNSLCEGITAAIGESTYTATSVNTDEGKGTDPNKVYGKRYTINVDKGGDLVLTFKTGNNHIHSIKVDYAPRTEWDFTDTSDTTLPVKSFENTTGSTPTGEYAGLKIDATTGKFNRRTDGDVQINAGTKIQVPVTGVETSKGVKVSVQWYRNGADVSYTVAGEPMTYTAEDAGKYQSVDCKGTNGYVDIVATSGDYLQKIKIEPIEGSGDDDDDYDPSSYDPKIDVWDIGLGTFDATKYNVRLTKNILSAMEFGNNTYEPLDADGILKFHTYQAGKKRVYGKVAEAPYTHAGTLKDINDSNVTYDGYIYIDSAGSNYWFEIEAEAGDIVTVYASYNTNPAQLSFFKIENNTITTGERDKINVPADAQKATTGNDKSKATPLKFYAPEKGRYAFCTSNTVAEKLVVARVTREHNKRITVSGTVTPPTGVSASDLSLQFTCKETGAVKTVEVGEDGKYSVNLYERYNYDIIVLPGQYIISEGAELAIDRFEDDAELKKTHNIKVDAVTLHTLTGEIKGLDDDAKALAALKISLVKPSDKLYQPEIEIDRTAKTYTAVLEEEVTYTIKTEGINDYELDSNVADNTETIGNLTADGTRDITYTKKPVHAVTLSLKEGDTDIAEALKAAGAKVTFTNLGLRDGCEDDKDYSYTFDIDADIALRDGVYKVEVTDSGKYVQNLTTNLVINGVNADGYTKEITFNSNITEWDFSSSDWTGMAKGKPDGYKGLVFNEVTNEGSTSKPHAVLANTATADSTIKIPIDTTKSWNVAVTYYYSANAKFENEATPSLHFDTTKDNGDATAIYKYTAGDNLINQDYVTITAITGGYGEEGNTSVSTYIKKIKLTKVEAYKATITVGATGCDYQTINEALEAVRSMERTENGKIKPVTISIAPGNYEEMLVIDVDNVKLVNASQTPSTALKNNGVNIDTNAVRITSYYGTGYSYYSMGSDCKWNEEVLKINKENGYPSFANPGDGTTSGSFWNATVVISGSNVSAEGIIFENSFNQYVSVKASQDGIVPIAGKAKEDSSAPRATLPVESTKVQEKKYVERAAALAIANNCSQIYFENCKFVGRQDTLYGGTPTTAAFYNCQIYGGTDYIFGGMTAVFAKCDLVFNTSDDKDDIGYITAAQTKGGRGYLMYNCRVTSTTPGEDTASTHTSKPGYLGRPWEANTGEALFYMTEVDEVDAYWQGNPTNLKDELKGKSLIAGAAWGSGLSGKSVLCQEYGTYEKSGVDNTDDRADWATMLTPEDAKTKANVSYFLGSDWNPFDGKDMVIKVVAPVYATPAAGEVDKDTEVTLAVVTPEDANIYYTTDGTEPTESTDMLYTAGEKIIIDKTMTIKAIAKKDGYLDERPVAEFEYTVATPQPPVQKVATPTAEPASNSTVAIGESITLNCATAEASIYYTTDGAAPTVENGSLYADGIEIVNDIIHDNTVTIKAIAVKEGMDNSEVAEFTYTYDANKTAQVSIPTAKPAAGAVPAGTVVKLSTATKGADIYYITGTDKNAMSDPDANSTAYPDAGITINEAVVIKAIALKEGMEPSRVATLEYTIDNGNASNGNGLEIILKEADYTYTGSAIIPEYTVTYDGEPLIPGIDYNVKCSNNVKVADDKARITVTGKGNLSGSTFKTFNIKQKSLTESDESGAGAVEGDTLVVVEGAKATPVLIYNGKKLAANKDFEFADGGNKTKKNWSVDTDNGTKVTVNGKGSFKDSRELDVVVVSKNDQKNVKLVVKLDNTKNKNIVYDGTPKEPAFASVENKGKTKTLEKGTDYIVSYPSDITSAGKKTFTVTGISKDCVGTVTLSYTIKPAAKDETKVKVKLNDTEVSTDNTKLKFVSTGVTFANDDLEVTYDGTKLNQGVDYKITYSANKKVGTAKYTVTGLANYKGVKKTGTFTIEAAAMSEDNVTVIVSDVAFGKPKVYKSVPSVIEKDTNTLLKASNYKVTYCSDADGTTPLGKSTAAGTAYVKIEGKGGYDSSTSIIKPYEIKAVEEGVKDLSTAKITFYDAAGATKPAKSFSYTGEPVQPYSMRITFKGKNNFVDVVLDKEADDFDSALYGKFNITFVNNTNKGTASVIVKADDDSYVGGKSATFKIAARSLKNFTWGSVTTSSFFDLFK